MGSHCVEFLRELVVDIAVPGVLQNGLLWKSFIVLKAGK